MAARTPPLRAYSKVWTAAVAACLATLVLAALFLPRSFQLTALSDWIQGILLLSGALSLIPNAVRSRGHVRVFWVLLAVGMALWFCYQATWIYFEFWLREEVPDIFAGDIVVFLHIVPMMAAMALRPHAPQDEYASRLRQLDFALLMFWWAYLYVFAVMAWQYVVPNVAAYSANLNFLYLVEKVAFLLTLFVAWLNSRDGWKSFYANLFCASLTYAASSYVANWALSRHVYYSGSLYDIPLAISMLWITLIGLWSGDCKTNVRRSGSASHGVWLARLGMITVFSLPMFAGWALLDPVISSRIRSFRLVLTLAAALIMGIMVFLRQTFLDRELLRLLNQSRESFTNLKRLQAQIMESEKLASIGQLVGGAAHELNNPIAAMLGYSDLLLRTPLNPNQHALAGIIGQHVRRAKSLVASLLSFAKQTPSTMAPVNLTTLLQTAVRMSQPQCKSMNIEIHSELQPDMPLVVGDSNQLLQVCTQILNTAIRAVDQQNAHEKNATLLTISSKHEHGMAVIWLFNGSCAANEPFNQPMDATREAGILNQSGPLSSLGMSLCRTILQQHHGRIAAQPGKIKGFTIRVELPVIPSIKEEVLAAAVPVTWQSQPFA
ncbi:MAG: HAMP domain-containing sensor histidine kinase [Candidatus Sulfotelmatobacter sp.]|jgi:signal transduction histidine kinase